MIELFVLGGAGWMLLRGAAATTDDVSKAASKHAKKAMRTLSKSALGEYVRRRIAEANAGDVVSIEPADHEGKPYDGPAVTYIFLVTYRGGRTKLVHCSFDGED